MHEGVESRLRALARRAGLAGAPPDVVAAALVLAVLAMAIAAWRWWPGSSSTGSGLTAREGMAASAVGAPRSDGSAATRTASTPGQTSSAATYAGSSAATLCVDVVGAVRHPGLYVLVEGTRVGTAVEVAGGASADAATEAINLAAKLQDGEQVVVPTRKQVKSGTLPGAAGGTTGGGGGGAAGGPSAKVDLNTADATQLDTLPGVGPSTAAKIVADRQSNGPFKTVDDLGRVSGIGPKKLDQLRDLVVAR
ncbi:MAG TPA: ComEA family DNA-binding protein [Coriobacteriia bacterium]